MSVHRERRAFIVAAVVLVASAGAAFWVPGSLRVGGFPVPLDDVFIHFGFARSAALGHPFAWIPGNGYSSGGTSLTYPLALAPGWLVGFRGERLAVFAAILACACLVDLARSLRRLVEPAPRWLTWALLPLPLAVPLLDWSLFSGMETALFAAVLGRALVAARRAETAPPHARARAQRVAGVMGALLVATRPEALPLALLLGLGVVHAAGSLGTAASLARALGPSGAFVAAHATVNRALTGEWAAAGAVRKLLLTSPFTTPLEVAIEVIKNLAALRSQAFESALGGPRVAWIFPALGVVAALDRRSRRLAIALLGGALLAIGLVALNATARFQNLRYAAPSILMLLAAAALGVAALARVSRPAAALALACATIAPAGAFPKQIDHFARASANIAGQQIELAHRLAARADRPRRVLVGDAGAIPYVSGLDAVDGLGLGGFRGLPFARASVHGVPAVVELIERLPVADRPDVLALYPSWWVGLADVFGRRVFAVRIADNVICGADEKVVYDADWSALAPPDDAREGAFDGVDVADLVDERAHDYAFPGPRGGFVVGAVLALPDGRPRFDAGRIVPEGKGESFVVRAAPGVASRLVLRTDDVGEGAARVTVERDDRVLATREVPFPPRPPGRWYEAGAAIGDVRSGDRVRVFAVRGAVRDYHVWLLRE